MNRKLFQALNVRTIALALALVLSIGTATGGTIAWLVDETGTLTNTFTYGDVNVKLEESVIDPETGKPKTDEAGNPTGETINASTADAGQEFKMLPSNKFTKDPKITIAANSEDCYVFVKVEKSENFDKFMTAEVDKSVWTELPNEDGVYYLNHVKVDADKSYSVLVDNNVMVNDTITKKDLNELDYDENGNKLTTPNYPTLSFKAYAVQKSNVQDEAAAWAIANGEDPTTPDSGAGTP